MTQQVAAVQPTLAKDPRFVLWSGAPLISTLPATGATPTLTPRSPGGAACGEVVGGVEVALPTKTLE